MRSFCQLSLSTAASRPTPVPLSFIFLVLLLTAQSATAQRVLRFDDAVSIALTQNVELMKAGNELDSRGYAVRRAKADFLPNLNLSTTPSRSWGLTFDQTAFRLVSQASTFIGFSARSGITLFDGFQNIASLREAQSEELRGSHEYERAKQRVVFDVVQAYLQVLLEQERVKIREEDVEAQSKQLQRIEEFTKLGARPISDLYQQQASLANSELQLLDAQRAVQISEIMMIQVLELDPLESYSFDAPAPEDLDLTVTSYDIDALLETALSRRLDLRALEASIAARREGIRVAQSQIYPSLTMSGSIGTSFSTLRERALLDANGIPVIGPNDQILTEQIPFGSQFGDNRNGSVSLGLSIPVFNRFQTRTSVQQSRIQYDNTVLDKQNLIQTIALEVRQAYLDYLSAAKRLDVTEKQLRAAAQALEVEQERYNLGASTLVELTQARATAVDAQGSRAQGIYQFVFQSKVIEYYLGLLEPSEPLFQ